MTEAMMRALRVWVAQRRSGFYDLSDAPCHYDHAEGSAWASGHNAAFETAVKEIEDILEGKA